MVRTIVNVVALLSLGVFVFYWWHYRMEPLEDNNKELTNRIDSLKGRITKESRRIEDYRDSIRRLDSLYKSKSNTRDSIRTVYVEKKIPAVDSFTADSLIEYFRSRYEEDCTP